ncbi:MAG: hypothetical protein QXQ18_02765 [Candidatus Aenigmatarchaeota archaeon]
MIIKDSMVVIHLAKITLLEKSCEHFKNVVIPEMVYKEILLGKEKGYPEVKIVEELIKEKKITVKRVKNKRVIEKILEFNIQRGEAEAVALYWEEKADYLATDDDNVRKKSVLLNINVIGTPAIILKLYRGKLIEKEKFEESLRELRKIGWFSDAVIDKILMEGLK